jgi:hypothetical protein
MRILKAGFLFFALVFSAGFALGTIRTLWVAPRLGARLAELIETPLMLGISAIAARFIALRLSMPRRVHERLAFGILALALMLAVEFSFVLRLRGLSFQDYVRNLDPVAGTAYYISLLFLAVMPILIARG